MIHYSKYSKSVQNVVIHYIFGSESLRVGNSLQMVNSLRVLFLVCRGLLGWSGIFKEFKHISLGVQSWSPFVTRKSGHIWRTWAEMTQTLMPKSTKVAQIHLPECNSAKIRQISAKIRQDLPNFRPNSPKFAKFRFTKGL